MNASLHPEVPQHKPQPEREQHQEREAQQQRDTLLRELATQRMYYNMITSQR